MADAEISLVASLQADITDFVDKFQHDVPLAVQGGMKSAQDAINKSSSAIQGSLGGFIDIIEQTTNLLHATEIAFTATGVAAVTFFDLLANDDIKDFGGEIVKITTSLESMGLVLVDAVAIVGLSLANITKGIDEAGKTALAVNRIALTAFNSPPPEPFEASRKAVKAFSDQLSISTGIAQRKILDGIDTLTDSNTSIATSMKMTDEAAKYAIATGKDFATVESELTQALAGKTSAAVADNIITDKQAKEGIKLSEVYKLMEERIRGGVEAYSNSLPGAMQITANHFTEMMSHLADDSGIIPILTKIAQWVDRLLPAIRRLADAGIVILQAAFRALKPTIDVIIAAFEKLEPIVVKFALTTGNQIWAAFKSIIPTIQAFATACLAVGQALFTELLPRIEDLWRSFMSLAPSMADVINNSHYFSDEIKGLWPGLNAITERIGAWNKSMDAFHPALRGASDSVKIFEDSLRAIEPLVKILAPLVRQLAYDWIRNFELMILGYKLKLDTMNFQTDIFAAIFEGKWKILGSDILKITVDLGMLLDANAYHFFSQLILGTQASFDMLIDVVKRGSDLLDDALSFDAARRKRALQEAINFDDGETFADYYQKRKDAMQGFLDYAGSGASTGDDELTKYLKNASKEADGFLTAIQNILNGKDNIVQGHKDTKPPHTDTDTIKELKEGLFPYEEEIRKTGVLLEELAIKQAAIGKIDTAEKLAYSQKLLNEQIRLTNLESREQAALAAADREAAAKVTSMIGHYDGDTTEPLVTSQNLLRFSIDTLREAIESKKKDRTYDPALHAASGGVLGNMDAQNDTNKRNAAPKPAFDPALSAASGGVLGVKSDIIPIIPTRPTLNPTTNPTLNPTPTIIEAIYRWLTSPMFGVAKAATLPSESIHPQHGVAKPASASKTTYTFDEIKALWAGTGADDDLQTKMAFVAMAESSGNSNAVGKNKGSKQLDVGLMQIGTGGEAGDRGSVASLKDITNNLTWAASLLAAHKDDPSIPWAASKHKWGPMYDAYKRGDKTPYTDAGAGSPDKPVGALTDEQKTEQDNAKRAAAHEFTIGSSTHDIESLKLQAESVKLRRQERDIALTFDTDRGGDEQLSTKSRLAALDDAILNTTREIVATGHEQEVHNEKLAKLELQRADVLETHRELMQESGAKADRASQNVNLEAGISARDITAAHTPGRAGAISAAKNAAAEADAADRLTEAHNNLLDAQNDERDASNRLTQTKRIEGVTEDQIQAKRNALQAATDKVTQSATALAVAQDQLRQALQTTTVAVTDVRSKLLSMAQAVAGPVIDALNMIGENINPLVAIFLALFQKSKSFNDIMIIMGKIIDQVARIFDAMRPVIDLLLGVLVGVVNVFLSMYNIIVTLLDVFGLAIQKVKLVTDSLDGMNQAVPMLQITHDIPTMNELNSGKISDLVAKQNSTNDLLTGFDAQLSHLGEIAGTALGIFSLMKILVAIESGKSIASAFGSVLNFFGIKNTLGAAKDVMAANVVGGQAAPLGGETILPNSMAANLLGGQAAPLGGATVAASDVYSGASISAMSGADTTDAVQQGVDGAQITTQIGSVAKNTGGINAMSTGMKDSLAGIAGNLAGGAINKALGGNAQDAAALGSIGGTVGAIFGGPIGSAIGSFAGEIIGGMFGPHYTDNKNPDITNAQINGEDYGQAMANLQGSGINGSAMMTANNKQYTAQGSDDFLQQISAYIAQGGKGLSAALLKEFTGATSITGGKNGILDLANGVNEQWQQLVNDANTAMAAITASGSNTANTMQSLLSGATNFDVTRLFGNGQSVMPGGSTSVSSQNTSLGNTTAGLVVNIGTVNGTDARTLQSAFQPIFDEFGRQSQITARTQSSMVGRGGL